MPESTKGRCSRHTPCREWPGTKERLETERGSVRHSVSGRCWVDGMPLNMQVGHKVYRGLYDGEMQLYCRRCGAKLTLPLL